jgi:Uma2 family endonuclease
MTTAPGIDEVELLVPEEETVPESDLHRIQVDLLLAGLSARFADAPDVAVFGRLAWFPDASDTSIRLDPDVMIVRGRPPGHRRSYKAWMEQGVQPAVLVEVWSEDDTDADYRRRLERARTYGVQEVVLVSPYGAGGVRVEHLLPDPDDPARFRTEATSSRGDQFVAVPSLGIEIAGGVELVVVEDGRRWPTTGEAFRRLWAAEARADEAEARAAEADARAAAAEARAARSPPGCRSPASTTELRR